MPNVVIQMYMVQYIRCFFRLRNNERSLYGCMGAIYQMFFYLRNDECCYTGVWGTIYQMQDYWSVEQRRLLYRRMGTIYQMRFFVCGITNVVIQVYGDNISDEIFRLWNDECYYTDRCG